MRNGAVHLEFRTVHRRLRPTCRTVVAALALVLIAPAAAALATAPPTAVVTMGDSYISGEAGRWLGNSVNVAGDRDGSDRQGGRDGGR